MCYVSFLWAQVCKHIMTFLDEQKDKEKKKYKDGLAEHVKSSTDAAFSRVEDEKQEVNRTVVELKRRIQDLRSWLSAALPLA